MLRSHLRGGETFSGSGDMHALPGLYLICRGSSDSGFKVVSVHERCRSFTTQRRNRQAHVLHDDGHRHHRVR